MGPGLWHWEGPHPAWQGSVRGGQSVSSYAIHDGGRLLLFDPTAPPGELVELATGRETAIVLTCPWHERDARGLVERFGWPVFSPAPDSQEDLMRTYGLTAEQAAGGSPDLAWLRAGDTGEAHWYAAGDRLPAASRTASCSGSRATARSSSVTRSSTSAKASSLPRSTSASAGSPKA